MPAAPETDVARRADGGLAPALLRMGDAAIRLPDCTRGHPDEERIKLAA